MASLSSGAVDGGLARGTNLFPKQACLMRAETQDCDARRLLSPLRCIKRPWVTLGFHFVCCQRGRSLTRPQGSLARVCVWSHFLAFSPLFQLWPHPVSLYVCFATALLCLDDEQHTGSHQIVWINYTLTESINPWFESSGPAPFFAVRKRICFTDQSCDINWKPVSLFVIIRHRILSILFFFYQKSISWHKSLKNNVALWVQSILSSKCLSITQNICFGLICRHSRIIITAWSLHHIEDLTRSEKKASLQQNSNVTLMLSWWFRQVKTSARGLRAQGVTFKGHYKK